MAKRSKRALAKQARPQVSFNPKAKERGRKAVEGWFWGEALNPSKKSHKRIGEQR